MSHPATTLISSITHNLGDVILELTVKYGNEPLGAMLTAYADKLGRISALNQHLATLNPDGNTVGQTSFTDTVQEIMAATQDYYEHLTRIPEDVRRFFLQVSDLAGSDTGVIDEIANTLGISLPVIPAPLLTMQAIRPKNYIMQIDAITNQLANLGEQTRLKVGKKAGQPVLTTVTLDMPDHMRIEGGHALSTYDKSIINGVTSLLESGNTVFSIPMLYHAMTGKQNPTVDEDLYDELSSKLEKMRRMMLSIDLNEEKDAQYITDENGGKHAVTDLTLEGYLLPLNRVSGVINGKRAELYQIIQHPPLYTYSKLRRQLASVRIALLSAPVNNNSTTIPLKTYLLQRIEMMKNPRNTIEYTNILYESVYKELCAEDANKTKKMRIRGYTTTILDYFVEQGYISAYLEYKSGRSIAGVRIQI